MQNLLITGGAGFLGGELARQALTEDLTKVIVLDALTYAADRADLANCERDVRFTFVEGDIANRPLVARLLEEHQIDAVLHAAAETHVDRSIRAPSDFVHTNVLGTCELLAATLAYWQSLSSARQQAFRFLHVSTDEVYGTLNETSRFTENSPCEPNSPYAASKAAADHFVRAYGQTYGLPVITTRGSNSYGPRQFPEKLIPRMICRALRGERLPVYGTGANVRDWLHATDHCRGVRLALEQGRVGETYNLGAGCERTNLEVVHEICRLIERAAPDAARQPLTQLIEHVEDRPGHDFRYALDVTKAREELGWVPEITFQTGLASTIAWYIENRAWCDQRKQDNIDC